ERRHHTPQPRNEPAVHQRPPQPQEKAVQHELTLDAATQPQHDEECRRETAHSDNHGGSGRDAVCDIHTRSGESANKHDRENDLDEKTPEQHTEPVNLHDPLFTATFSMPVVQQQPVDPPPGPDRSITVMWTK